MKDNNNNKLKLKSILTGPYFLSVINFYHKMALG